MESLDVPRFYSRLGKIHAHYRKNRNGNVWGEASCLSLNHGPYNEDNVFQKSTVLHQYLFGVELPDTIILLTLAGNCYILSTKKKCEYLEPAVGNTPAGCTIVGLTLIRANKGGANNDDNFKELLKYSEIDVDGTSSKVKVGIFLKESSLDENDDPNGKIAISSAWESKLNKLDNVELIDASLGISIIMAVKEDTEIDSLKKSSILANKVLKRGFTRRMEEIIDSEISVTHEQLAGELDGMIEDPSKVDLANVPKSLVQSCYFPIVQSGGVYDIKISAQSTNQTLKYDIILVSFGARYQDYCSNIARTFLVDPPKFVSETYETLLTMHEACMKAMVPGKPLKGVHAAAVKYLKKSGNENLIKHLPKSMGFAMGLDVRDSNFVLSSKNQALFKPGMVYTLSVGFNKVQLDDVAKASCHMKSAVKSLDTFALLISDMVGITSGTPDIYTKHAKALSDISYTINDDEDEDDDSSEDGSRNKSKKQESNDAAYARALSRAPDNFEKGDRRSNRLANSSTQEAKEGSAEREKKQVQIMARNNEKRLRELARQKARSTGDDDKGDTAEEIEVYTSTKHYPDYVVPNQVKVDMSRECVILPICGNPIPFHISTIKNVVLPDPDSAAYLRINFYTAGVALGKDAPVNTVKLIQKYAPYATFIRELTFRSLDPQSLTTAYRQLVELRKRVRMRELQEQEEANLVVQEKLVRTRNERVPRLSDLSMRPVFAGRKTQGNLEAHTNGLRFISTRSENLEIMYKNIKHAIFQPCENEIMVLIHFHLKNPIMVGKKRQRDIQYFTEVIDASLVVDAGRRSMYDPDEMDDEQRERQLRKKLNQAFKEFCSKVEAVSRKNNLTVEFEVPYRDLGFQGTPSREMVFVQPTMNCLVNLTETPFFLCDMSEVDHVHFERVTFMSNSIDMVLINKDRSKAPTRVDMIPNSDKDNIQEWLTDMEYSYTEGPMNLNWKSIMQTVADDDRFYMNTHDDEVTEKDAGWDFLRMYGKDEEESDDSDEDDPEFEIGKKDNESSEETGGEDSDESDFDSESDEESDFDADEDLEEQGMDWDEMEKEAAADDRRKRQSGGDDNDSTPRKRQRGNPRSGGRQGQNGRSVGRQSGGRQSVGRQSGGRSRQSAGGRRRR